jgi:hypothetical protein
MALVRCVGPLSYRAYVDMDELAGGVVADASGFEGFGGITQDRGWDALDAKIDGFGLDVLGVFGGVSGSAGA